eukprot:s3787_g7.t1
MTTRKSRWGPHRANSCKRWLHRLATTSLARNTCIFYAFVLVASLSGRQAAQLALRRASRNGRADKASAGSERGGQGSLTKEEGSATSSSQA